GRGCLGSNGQARLGHGTALAAPGDGRGASRMTPERWQQVKAVLATALEMPPAERSNYLDKNCAGDQSLRETVQQLLANEESSRDFLTPEALATTTAAVLPDEGSFWLG